MKIISLMAVLILIASQSFADNSARIAELEKEGQEVLAQRQQALEVVQRAEQRILQIQGALQELTNQDKAKESK